MICNNCAFFIIAYFPTYYKTDKNGVPSEWVGYIKNTIAKVAPEFTMQRMLQDYFSRFYSPLFENGMKMRRDGYETARNLVLWKEKVQQAWDQISVDSLKIPDVNKGFIKFGEHFVAEVTLNIPGLDPEDIGVEILMGNKTNGDIKKIDLSLELDMVAYKNGKATFSCSFPLKNAGVHDYSFRIFPKHPDLRYRMDFPLVKWV